MSVAIIAGKAVADLYSTFTFTSPLPDLWIDEAPQRDSGGTANALPWIVLKTEDRGTLEYLSGLDRIEVVRVTLDIYDPDPANLKAVVKGVCYNGSVPSARAGLDDAATLTLPTGHFLNKCERVTETVNLEQPKSTTAGPVFHATLTYDVELFVDGDTAA